MDGDSKKIQKGCGGMNTKEISGRRQMEFLTGFDFVREAGTAGEVKAAKMIRDTLDSFGVKNRMEEFDFWGFRINRAVLKVVEPYQKEYWGRRSESGFFVCGEWRCCQSFTGEG